LNIEVIDWCAAEEDIQGPIGVAKSLNVLRKKVSMPTHSFDMRSLSAVASAGY
jgi:hypothetical protein